MTSSAGCISKSPSSAGLNAVSVRRRRVRSAKLGVDGLDVAHVPPRCCLGSGALAFRLKPAAGSLAPAPRRPEFALRRLLLAPAPRRPELRLRRLLLAPAPASAPRRPELRLRRLPLV